MKNASIKPVFVDIIPDRLEEGILYICERYNTAIHKCCCGCGEEVVTPLTPADWSVRKSGETVSIMPSIGNWNFVCKSHYYIHQNQVVWAAEFSKKQIERVRKRDKADKKAYIKTVNSQKSSKTKIKALLSKIWNVFTRWL